MIRTGSYRGKAIVLVFFLAYSNAEAATGGGDNSAACNSNSVAYFKQLASKSFAYSSSEVNTVNGECTVRRRVDVDLKFSSDGLSARGHIATGRGQPASALNICLDSSLERSSAETFFEINRTTFFIDYSNTFCNWHANATSIQNYDDGSSNEFDYEIRSLSNGNAIQLKVLNANRSIPRILRLQ